MSTWALVVGINNYPKLPPDQQLRGAVADACDFAEWALDPAGGNVPHGQLYFWTHPWPAKATGELQKYFDGSPPKWDSIDEDWADVDKSRAPTAGEIIHTAERVGRDIYDRAFGINAEPSRILVFVAGHGLRTSEIGNPARQTCFVAGDFRPRGGSSVAEGLVPCNSLRRSLRKDRFNEVLLFFDCCRNDPLFSSIRALPLCDYQDDKEEPDWGIGNAAGENKRAYETEEEPYRGAFSRTLVEGLRYCRDPATGALAIDGLDRYVKDNIARATATGQAPEFTFEAKARPLVIIPGSGVPAPLYTAGPMVHFGALAVGTQVAIKDGDNRAIPGLAALIAGPEPVQAPDLTDGLYSLEPENLPDSAVLFKQPRDKHVYFV